MDDSRAEGNGEPHPVVLLVDDSRVHLANLSKLLRGSGYHVELAESGWQAERELINGSIDLVLLDVGLPDGSGFDWCARWRAEGRTARVPVLFMTGLDDVDSKVEGFAVGGVDFITKPFEEAELLARVRMHLEMVRLQRQLHREIASRDAALVELDAFAHTVAHDLKSPLSGMVGFAELIRDEAREGRAAEVVDLCEELLGATRQGLHLVEETLLLASLRGERAEPERVDMEACLERSLRNLTWMIEREGARVEREGSLPTVWGRDTWLAQVWMNLITNAVRHGGSPARVEIRAGREGSDAVFHVEDNGPGIAPEQVERLFQTYSRLEDARGEGSGLGLSIVRRILRRLGGDVEVGRSDLGGADFCFRVPLVHQ